MKKRSLSLFLILATLLSMIVVPAYAADVAITTTSTVITDPSATTCGCGCGQKFSQVEWKKWTGEVASGHFYLAEDFAAPEQINVISGEKVVLDLRGKTITTAGNSRLFDVQGYVAVLDTVGGGRMMAKSSSGSGYTGGVVIIKDNETPDATFELFSGTITPAPGAKTPKTGGLIYAEAGGSFIMHGGLLLNGKSTASGGCIGSTGNGTEVKILGGQIIGGYAESSGGNVYAGDHVALTMENCTIIGGHADNMGGNVMLSNSNGVIKSCNIGNGVSLSNPSSGTVYGGGNICAYASATMTLESSHVYGGYALRNGGNICLGNGTMTLKNNTITGGSCGDRGANLASITPTSHTTITGGTIDGDVYYANGNLTLKGAVKIGLGATGLRLNKTRNKFDVSGLTAGAEIYIDTDYTGLTGATSQYIKPAFRTVLTDTANGMAGGKAADGEIAGYCPHCGEKVAWQPYGTENASHTYLTADITDAAEVTVSTDLVIDLNSFDITATGRAFHIAEGGKLTVVDSIGTGVITGKGVAGENGGVFHNAGTLKLYGGKYVYASGKAVAGGGVVYNAGTLALYGAVMDASKFKNTASTAFGGAIYSANGTHTVTVNGLRVESGSAYHGGGAFFGFDNKVTIRNANFLKGTAVTGGGNVSFMGTSSNANGTMSLTGVSILDGKSTGGSDTGYSGNIYMGRYKTCTLTDTYIAGGTAENGGNFAANNGTTITCTNCIIEGGTATDKGGLISIPGNSGKLTLDRCLLTNGTATGNGGGIHVNNGYLTIKGGEISYCTASGSYGGNLYAASDDGTGVVLNADAEGNAPLICKGSAADAGGNMFVSDIVTINAVKFANGTAPNGGNDLHVGSTSTTLTLGSGIEGDVYMLAAKGLLTSEVYGGAIKNITCEATNANFYLDGKYGNCGITVKDKTMYVSVAAVMDKAGNAAWYSSNADAVEACDEKHYVKLFTDGTLVLTKNLYADINGNTVTVSGNYTFYGMDSTGDQFAAPTGKVIFSGATGTQSVAAPNGNTYVALTEGSETSYHRLDMKITGVSIRPASDGMYYSAKWACDDVLKAKIDTFGVVASTKEMPGTDFAANTENLWTTFQASQFENGKVQNGAVLSGIMKAEDRTAQQNNANGTTPVYAKAYIALTDGTVCVSGDNIQYSLYDVMKGLDRLIMEKPLQYRKYNLTARNFYEKWKDNGMDGWKLSKIPAPADDGVINVLMVGSSFCYYYVQELYALGQAAGIDIRVCNLYYSGCPLEKHYNWWVGGNSNYQYYETYHDGRKLTSNVSLEWGLAQQEWDFISLQESSSRSFNNHPTHAQDTQGMWDPLLDYFLEQFPDAQVLWHQPWTYQAAAYGKEGASYTPELQQSNQDKIEYFSKQICDHYNTGEQTLVQRVNTGRAWQIMRTEFGYDYLCCRLGKTSADGVDHAGDGYHDGDIGGGQLLNACVWFEIVTGKSVVGNTYIPAYSTSSTLDATLFDNLNVVKTDKGYALTPEFVAQIQEAAHKAVAELGLTVK